MKQQSGAMIYSFSELAFLLFMIALVAAAVLFEQERHVRREAAALAEERDVLLHRQDVLLHRQDVLTATISGLEEEVDYLNAELERYLGGNVPCDRRWGSPIPWLVGRVHIQRLTEYSLLNHETQRSATFSSEERAVPGALVELARDLFLDELRFARAYSCYIRVEIVNETNNFALFREVDTVLRRINIVPVPGDG